MEEMKFKTGQEVLVRDSDTEKWSYAIYSHFNGGNTNYPYITAGNREFQYCIPYKNNEHLVGTTEEPEEILPKGTPLMISDDGKLWFLAWASGDGSIITYVANHNRWKYKIKVIDFDFKNPENSLKYNIAKSK